MSTFLKMLIGKAGRIGLRALILVLSNRTTVLWLFNFFKYECEYRQNWTM